MSTNSEGAYSIWKTTKRLIACVMRIMKLTKYRLKAQVEKDKAPEWRRMMAQMEKDEGPEAETLSRLLIVVEGPN